MNAETLYARLGGYDAIAAVTAALLLRLQSDDKLRRFWDHRGADGLEREKHLLIDFLCESAGGPLMYTGRDMLTAHKGMRVDEDDWTRLIGHLSETLESFGVADREEAGRARVRRIDQGGDRRIARAAGLVGRHEPHDLRSSLVLEQHVEFPVGAELDIPESCEIFDKNLGRDDPIVP